MGTEKIYRTEGIILKHLDSGEADRLLTLLTPDHGKIRAIARGVRRPCSKLGGHLEPLRRCQLVLARGKTFDRVTQAQLIEVLSPRDLRRVAYAIYLLELVDAFAVEEGNQALYSLLLMTLRELGRTQRVEVVCRYFELQLLGQVGYRPELQRCLSCHSALRPEVNFFSPSGGGVLCPHCRATEPVAQPLSVDSLKVLRFLQKSRLPEVSHLRLSEKLLRELEKLLRGYLRYLLEREIKSTDFLDRLKVASDLI